MKPLDTLVSNAVNAEFGGLVGKTVKSVRALTRAEATDLGWHFGIGVPMIIFFTDGSFIVPMSDPEGNSAGALMIG